MAEKGQDTELLRENLCQRGSSKWPDLWLLLAGQKYTPMIQQGSETARMEGSGNYLNIYFMWIFIDSSDMLVKSAPQFWGRLCSLCNSRMGQKLGAVTSFQIKCLEIIFFKWCQGEIWWLINSLSTHSLNVYYEPDTSVSLRERISCRHGTHIRWWRTTRCREGDTINKKKR